jgi:hypothetical protein
MQDVAVFGGEAEVAVGIPTQEGILKKGDYHLLSKGG